MTLAVGTRLGSYEIVSVLGAGGMGEVYRAHDSKLRRDVALKVLPKLLASDADRLARLAREARLLATLNHANIAAIYGLEDSGATLALVLELVEGPTLADRIAKRPMPPADAIKIATEIAEALEAAHEKGIVHRDLKPANVKLTSDDHVKVLDFGLAKALDETAPGAAQPTMTAMASVGVIVGTAPYMSPEQAKGQPVDRRADIWAFGCVLYEMLTGRRAFDGDDVAAILVAVMTADPDWSALPPATPAWLVALLRRCLRKDVRQRQRDIGDVRLELEEGLRGGLIERARVAEPLRQSWSRQSSAGLFVAGGLVGIAIGAATVAFWRSSAEAPVAVSPHVVVPLPAEGPISSYGARPALAISPDGSRIVYTAEQAGSTRLYLRDLDQFDVKPIPDTDGGFNPFFSPDGLWIGFFTVKELKKISVSGGAAQTICLVSPATRGAVWSQDGTILLVDGVASGTTRVSPGSAKSSNCIDLGERLTMVRFQDGERSHRWPAMLPGARAILFTVIAGGEGRPDGSSVTVQDTKTGERRILVHGGSGAQYMSTGHLVYGRDGAIFAVPFDLQQLRVTGPEMRVIESVRAEVGGVAQFATSAAGSLVYVSGPAPSDDRTLVWVERGGAVTPLAAPPRRYFSPALAPDGQSVAVDVASSGDVQDVWRYDLASGLLARVTLRWGVYPAWTPDGRRIAFSSVAPIRPTDKGTRPPSEYVFNIFWQAADGSGPAEPLVTRTGVQFTGSWTPDGKRLAFADSDFAAYQFDIWTVSAEGDHKAEAWLRTPYDEIQPTISPDGRWLAYASNESGRYEIYVRAFAAPDSGKWLVSRDGGLEPRWARSGQEIFYRAGDSMMTAQVTSTGTLFQSSQPRELFKGRFVSGGTRPGYPQYDVSPDGRRFLMVQEPATPPAPRELAVVINWDEQLKQQVRVK